jgi:hypothetical protein
MWSFAVFEPAFPGRSWTTNASPVPSGPWSANASNGWNPNPRLNVGAAFCFSEDAQTAIADQGYRTDDDHPSLFDDEGDPR